MEKKVLGILSIAVFTIGFQFLSAVNAQTSTTVKSLPLPTPTPAPTVKPEDEEIKIDTELVNISVRVIDRNNRPINNIPQNEFKIYEDGILQKIDFFSKSEVPTNYSLVIDNSGSLRSLIDQVIEAGKILVSSNKQDDETAIIRFVSSDKIEILQDFSKNKTDLNDALDNMFIEGGQTAIIDALFLSVERLNKQETPRKDLDRTRRAIVLVTDAKIAPVFTARHNSLNC